MSDLSDIRLTEADVQAWVGDTSFRRSTAYVRSGAVINPRRLGMTLKAQCQGSASQPYRVEATLTPGGIAAANCSCPVGWEGRCKHVAALLLTWINDPSDFRETEDLQTALERRSKDELIGLIQAMVTRYPDLELLLELPLPGSTGTQRAIEPQVIERQVRGAFAQAGDGWDAAANIATSLQSVLALGEGYVRQHDWSNAVVVYRTLAQAVLDHYEQYQDEDGQLGMIVNDCVAGLGECLAESQDAMQCDEILRALFDIYCWDLDFGGIGIGDEVPDIIKANTSPAERQRVAQWARAILPSGSSAWGDSWRRQVLGGFVLELEMDAMDDETFLRTCRETGRLHDLVMRLLHLGRVEEALADIRQAPNYELIQMADLLIAKGYVDQAEALVRERAGAGYDNHLAFWLKRRARERGDAGEALAIAEQMFWALPSMPGYHEVKELAQQTNRWDEVRARLLKRLTREKRHDLLTMIYLGENEIDQALEVYGKTTGGIYGGGAMGIQVARAAEETHPRESLRLYGEAVNRLIQMQGRDNYATAAGYLQRMRALYRRLDEEQIWQSLVTDLRTRHKRLRALQEELTKAGL